MAQMRGDLAAMRDKTTEHHGHLTFLAQIIRDIASAVQTYFENGICAHRGHFLKRIVNSSLLLRLTGRTAQP